MATFRDYVDTFISTPKSLVGEPYARTNDTSDGSDLFWLLSLNGGSPSRDRLFIKAYDRRPREFVIMVQVYWEPIDREIPVLRVMQTPDRDPHPNHPPLPAGITEFEVAGPRAYLWEYNCSKFRPTDAGLPYAIPLDRKNHDFHNAIRYICGEANISLSGVTLPDFPTRGTLL